MRSFWLQTATSLAVLVTCCLAYESPPPKPVDCVDWRLPASLQNETVANLHKNHKHWMSSHNYTNTTKCREITVLQVLAHALNTTGNQSLTASTLGLSPGCLGYLEFTLKEVAFQHLKDPDGFPGNATVTDLFKLLFSNTTYVILHDVDRVVNALKNKSVEVNQTIHQLIKDDHFNRQSNFLLMMWFAINASDLNQAASQLGLDKDLLNETFHKMTEHLYTSVDGYQKDLSLECAIRHLHSARLFLQGLKEFLERERLRWTGKTLNDLFAFHNASLQNRTVLSVLKEAFSGSLNLTFLQFFGKNRVSLDLFDLKLEELAKITFVNASIIYNLTVEELFNFAFKYAEVIKQYKTNVELSRKRKEMIVTRYGFSIQLLTISPLNLTSDEIHHMTDLQIENYAIRYFFWKYASDRNITLGELENRSSIILGALKAATVHNFVDLLFNISGANIFRAIKDQLALEGIIGNLDPLFICNLRRQILAERHPITTNYKLLSELQISYFVFQGRWDVNTIYNTTIYDFVVKFLKYSSWEDFLKMFGFENSDEIETKFKMYTFKDFCGFNGMRSFEIFKWKLSFFMRTITHRIKTDVDECANNRSCAQIDGVRCVNYPGGFLCHCPPDKNLDAYRRCTDINECKLRTTHCRPNSNCWNTAGSYECPCNKGFNDANGTCKDINECDSTHICLNSKNVECLNTIGSFRCQCRPGYVYSFKYQVCIDRNECVEKPCSAVNHSVCHNKQPYYSCDCLPGFNATKNDSVSPVARLLNCTDINECDTGSHRCHKYATCSNTIGGYRCKCKGGYIGNGFSCKAERLFEPDPSRERNVYRTKKVNVPLGFCFGGKIYDKLYISTNGIISIGKRYRKSSPVELKDLKKDVLAPFWASSALYRFDSSVRYRELNEDDRHSASLLTKINKFVANSTRLDNFEANWAIIVTWKNLTPKFWFPWWWRFYFGRHSPFIDERNTFQAVIATNGSASVFIYLYKDDGMTWWRLGRDATVGYSTKSSDSYQVDNYFTQKIFNIDKQSFQDPAGNERKGALVLVCHPKTQRAPTPEEKCLDWIRKQSRKNNDWVGDLPQCPCTDQDMRFASVSLRFPFWGNFGGARCYVLSRKQKTKSCCYFGGSFFASGALIPRSDPRAGRALRYNPRSSYKDYQRHDAEAYDMCCVQSSLYCGDYHQLRPVDEGCEDTEPEPCQCRWRFGFRKRRRRGGRRRRGFRRGWFFGDPHITTLDGIKYSFNGLGDYIVLQTLDRTNLIHGRTKRPLSKFGGLSKATVFSGFALRSSKNTTVQVLFSDVMAGNLSIATKNTSGHCQHFGINDLQEIDGFVLSPSTTDNSTLAVLFDSGLTAEITPGLDLLQISFTIPAGDFENKTMGLLGKLNDDKNDDLMYRNGTTIPADSIDKDVFYYAQTWKVPDDEGLFVFSNCSMEPVFYDGDFKPLFLSELQQNITDRMRSVCGNNTECLLDFLLTGNEALANGTLKFEIENDKIKKVFDNLPPVITMNPKTVNARADQEFTVNVTAKDPNSDAVTLQVDPDSLPQGAAFDNITGTFTWTPPSGTKTVNIRIIARDSKGAASVVTIQIRFCDCENGGDCLFSTIQKSYANSSLQLVSCNCSDKYTGDLCETQVDPCADKPCYKGVNCATIQQPFGYKCGDCPSGYDGNGEICSDFDECLNASRNNCTQNEKCTNIVGSFKCDCKPGYSRVANSNSCTDVNECDSLVVVSKCKDNTKCNNTLGSYNCSCERGYQGDPLKGCTDIDECSPPNQKCFGHSCTNTPGSFKCACDAGYKLRKLNDTQSCVDIDECKFPINNNCSQICKNVPASYNCACNPGLELNSDKRTCSVAPGSKCDESNGGCEKMCTNTSSVVRCHCPRGYNLTDGGKHCQDINECLKDNGGCSGKKSCINLNGTYICSCSHGYRLKADKRTCEDINECLKHKGNCSQTCENIPGGKRCKCKPGYRLKTADNTTCDDVNECKEGAKCSFGRQCHNRRGGYWCRCKDRRMFSDGSFECKKSKRFRLRLRCLKLGLRDLVWSDDYEDEFSDLFKQLQDFIVKNVNKFFRSSRFRFRGSYLGCRVRGFKRGSVLTNVSVNFDENSNVTAGVVEADIKKASQIGDLTVDPSSSTFQDTDECLDPSLHHCHKDATCKNEPGSFSCHCKDGYYGDGIDCKDVTKKKGNDDTIMIILLCTLIPLAVIIIIIVVYCFLKRKTKGDLRVQEDIDGGRVHHVQLHETNKSSGNWAKGNEVYYGHNIGRRVSDDSATGRYDMAGPGNSFANEAKATNGGTYDVQSGSYYDNPAAASNESLEAAL